MRCVGVVRLQEARYYRDEEQSKDSFRHPHDGLWNSILYGGVLIIFAVLLFVFGIFSDQRRSIRPAMAMVHPSDRTDDD